MTSLYLRTEIGWVRYAQADCGGIMGSLADGLTGRHKDDDPSCQCNLCLYTNLAKLGERFREAGVVDSWDVLSDRSADHADDGATIDKQPVLDGFADKNARVMETLANALARAEGREARAG